MDIKKSVPRLSNARFLSYPVQRRDQDEPFQNMFRFSMQHTTWAIIDVSSMLPQDGGGASLQPSKKKKAEVGVAQNGDRVKFL